MKKLLLVLFLSIVSSTIYAQTPQVRANQPSEPKYANGDGYGFYIDEIPGAVSYEWSVQGNTGATIWPAWDTAIDLTFSYAGGCELICTVTMDDSTVRVYSLSIGVGYAP